MYQNYLTLFLLFCSFLILTVAARAQNQQDDSLSVDLDPIEVTAIRSNISAADAPLAISIKNRSLRQLYHDASVSLTSMSGELPGIWANDRQNYALGEQMTIRGVGWRASFGVRGVQVILDGIPLTVADGQTILNIIDPAFLRRAELIRGPAGSFWGNSSGGVLYLSTKPNLAEDSDRYGLRAVTGSYGYRKIMGQGSYSYANHTVNVHGSYMYDDGFRDYSSAELIRSGISGSVELTSVSRLEYMGAMIDMPFAEHPSGLTADQASESPTMANPVFIEGHAGKSVTQGQSGLRYLLDTDAGLLTLSGYGIYRDLHNPLPFGIITVNRLAGGLRATLDNQWNRVTLNIGVETKLQNDDRAEYENAGGGERGAITVEQVENVWNQALFATSAYALGKFNLLASLRYDRMTFSTDAPTAENSGERVFQAFSPGLGLNYRTADITVYSNLSTSFEAPTTTELVNRPDGGNGFNPELEPEKTVGLEAGARGELFNSLLTYDIALYRLWIYDLLFPFQLESSETFFRNQGKTTHNGIETQVIIQPNARWRWMVTGNITDAVFHRATTLDGTSLRGNRVPGIPEIRLNSALAWSPDPFRATLSVEYISDYTVDNLNTFSNDAYSVVDAKFSYKVRIPGKNIGMYPFLNIRNLFDMQYNGSVVVNAFGSRFFEPAPGRNWQAGISFAF